MIPILVPTVLSGRSSRPNLFTFPAAFDNAAWTKENATVTANDVVAPDGTLTAETLLEAATTSVHRLNRAAAVVGGSPYSVSIHGKKLDRRYLVIRHNLTDIATFNNISLDLDTGLATVHGGSSVAAVRLSPGGWFRLMLWFSAGVSGSGNVLIGPSDAAPTNAAPSYAGSTTSGIYLWGAKLEAGAPATAYP